MARQYRSKLLAAVHETAEGMHQVGALNKKTMREFDEACLTPIKDFGPAEIIALREREDVSQAVFARYLGLSIGLVSQWERGEKHPRGASRKLLTLVDKHGLDAVA